MFRIIMPVYNAENYLDQAVESILNQSLDFKQNVVLHLIDDASSDRSPEICKRYAEEYPRNIIYTRLKQNGGVSRARNYGLKKCRFKRGVIAGFVDSDDCLDKKALERVQAFFGRFPKLNAASIQMEYFGERTGAHKANWRFEDKEIVDIEEDYNYPQYYIGGFFVKKSALRRLKFDEDMHFWEDASAITRVILREGRYGLVRDAVYMYRAPASYASRMQDETRYTTFLEKGYMRMMKYCKSKKRRVISYVQYLVAYHLRLYLAESNRETVLSMLPEEKLPEFKEKLGEVLQQIDDDIIINLNTSLPIVEAMLSLKRGKKVRVKKTCENGDMILSYKGNELARMSGRRVLLFETLDKPGFEGMRRGRFTSPVYAMKAEDYIYAEHNGQRIESVKYPCKKRLYILDELMRNYKNAGFAIALPADWDSAMFGLHAQGTDIPLSEVEL